MAHPRGARVRSFPQSRRAVVLEAEWKVDMSRIDPDLKPLVDLAKDQGWSIAGTDNGRLVWRGPNSEGPVYTGYRARGRELKNYRAELVRAGLKLDEKQAKAHIEDEQVAAMVAETSANPVSIDELKDLLNKVMTHLPALGAKAALYDRAQQDAKEWEELASSSNTQAEEALRQRDELQMLVDNIRKCFSLSPWAILPEIAKLVGVDAGVPTSLADQATTARRPA